MNIPGYHVDVQFQKRHCPSAPSQCPLQSQYLEAHRPVLFSSLLIKQPAPLLPHPPQSPYLVTHSSRCVSRQSRAHTLVPHFIHRTLPQYPHTSQNTLAGGRPRSSHVPLASRYVSGGCASKALISRSVGGSGTRDMSSGSLSPGWDGGGALYGGGRRAGGDVLAAALAASASVIDVSSGSWVTGVVALLFVFARRLLALAAAALASACWNARKSSRWFANVFCDCRIFLTVPVFPCAVPFRQHLRTRATLPT